MNEPTNKYDFSLALRILLGLAAASIVLYFMHFLSNLINNLFLALMITVVASPLLYWLRKKGAPNWLAFLLTLTAVAIGVLLLVIFIANAATTLTLAIPAYIEEAQDFENALDGLDLSLGQIDLSLRAILNVFDFEKIFQVALSSIGGLLDALGNIFIIILFVVFMLVQVFSTPRILRREIVAGNIYLQRLVDYFKNLHRYLMITTIIAIVTGGLDTILFFILGIPNPVLWGGIAAIMSFVPTVGFWLAAIPPTLLALLEFGPLVAGITLAGILVINGFADNVIKPRYLGEGLNLAPFIVIFSVIFWTVILGPVGAIIGVPLSMLIKSLLFEADDTMQWLGHLMSSGLEEQDLADPEANTETITD